MPNLALSAGLALLLLSAPEFARGGENCNRRNHSRYNSNYSYYDNRGYGYGAGYYPDYRNRGYGYDDSRSFNRGYGYDQGYYGGYGSAYGDYRPYWSPGKSAAIIGGSAAAGAVVGGMAGGGKGAALGAAIGGIGGLVYDQATKRDRWGW